MNVASVRQHFLNLAEFTAQLASSAKAAAELRQIAEGLTPFAGQSYSEFVEFLNTAAKYKRDGVIPPPNNKGKKGVVADPSSAPEKLLSLAAETEQLLQRSKTVGVSKDEFDRHLKKLDSLKVAEIRLYAALIKSDQGLSGTKPELLSKLKFALERAKGTTNRAADS